MAGLGLFDNDGMVKGNKDTYKRITGQINADYKFNDWLQITSNTSIEKWNRKSLNNGYASFLNAVVSIDPLTPAYVYDKSDMGISMESQWNLDPVNHNFVMTPPGYTDENPIWYGTSKYVEDATANPLAMRDRSHGERSGIRVRGSLAANITPIDCVTFTSRLGYRINYENYHDYGFPYWLSTIGKGDNYSLTSDTNTGLYYQWENFINFNKDFGKHSVGAMAGMSFTKYHRDDAHIDSSDKNQIFDGDAAPNFLYASYLNANGISHLKVRNAPTDQTELSYFGRLTYSYDNRYFFQFNIRRDAYDSSRLAKDKRWGTFPSLSAGWTISNEEFFKNLVNENAVSFLKLRGSWGKNGNTNILGDYSYASSVKIGGYYNFGDEATTASSPSGYPNPDLTWETAEQVDFGLDARFLNNRLSFGFDWYRKMTRDLLIKIKPMPESGYSEAMVNSGEVLNTGFEFELGWRDRIGDLKYSINANFSTLKNEVQKVNTTFPRKDEKGIDGFNSVMSSSLEAGHTMWYFRGYKYAGVDPQTGSAVYYDKNGNYTTSPAEADKQDLGSGIPKFTYGLTLNLEYKGFDFTVFGTGAYGNKIYNLMVSADRNRLNGLSTYWHDSWKQPGDNATYPDMNSVKTSWIFYSSSAAVFSGSYFKIKQIQLGYTIPAKYTKKALINNLRLSVSLDDFFTFTSYPGADPETSSFNSGVARGWDNGNYPMSKKVVLGATVTF